MSGRRRVTREESRKRGDGQADAGRDCGTHLARPNSQARKWTGKYYINFPCSADHEQDQPYPMIHTLAIYVTIHFNGLLLLLCVSVSCVYVMHITGRGLYHNTSVPSFWFCCLYLT